MKTELRHSFEIRAAEGEKFVLEGRAVSYGKISSSQIIAGVRERIMPGAFRDSLASGQDVKALLNHNSATLPLGRTANGTLQLSDSPDGLDIKVQLDRANSMHRDVYASVKRGDLNEMSFAFTCDADDITDETYDGQRCAVRNVRKAKLFDVSVVTTPFYGNNATAVAARSEEEDSWADEVRAQLEQTIADSERRSKVHELGMEILKDLKLAK